MIHSRLVKIRKSEKYKIMKRAHVLLLCLFLSGPAVVAQQLAGNDRQSANSVGAATASKKSTMKPKAFKKQNAAAVDDDGTPLARAQHSGN